MASAKRKRRIAVEVAHARADAQTLVALELDEDATLEQAIAASGILALYPEIDLRVNAVGVFGEPAALDRPLRDRDRVEIYRPLLADPKESRRRRAAQVDRAGQRNGHRRNV